MTMVFLYKQNCRLVVEPISESVGNFPRSTEGLRSRISSIGRVYENEEVSIYGQPDHGRAQTRGVGGSGARSVQ